MFKIKVRGSYNLRKKMLQMLPYLHLLNCIPGDNIIIEEGKKVKIRVRA